jgi:hypothetical protein
MLAPQIMRKSILKRCDERSLRYPVRVHASVEVIALIAGEPPSQPRNRSYLCEARSHIASGEVPFLGLEVGLTSIPLVATERAFASAQSRKEMAVECQKGTKFLLRPRYRSKNSRLQPSDLIKLFNISMNFGLITLHDRSSASWSTA